MKRDRERTLHIVYRENNHVVIRGSRDIIDSLYEHGIGEKISIDKLKVSNIELAYLSTRFSIVENNNKIDIGDILKNVEDMLRFIVYLDLRKRGYDVKLTSKDSPIDLLVWEKGKRPIKTQPRYGVKIVTEGLGIRVLDLSSVLKYCESMGLQLVLALVSNDGVITYYKAFSLKS